MVFLADTAARYQLIADLAKLVPDGFWGQRRIHDVLIQVHFIFSPFLQLLHPYVLMHLALSLLNLQHFLSLFIYSIFLLSLLHLEILELNLVLLDLLSNNSDVFFSVTLLLSCVDARLPAVFDVLEVPLVVEKLLQPSVLLLGQVLGFDHSLVVGILAKLLPQSPYHLLVFFDLLFVGIGCVTGGSTLLVLLQYQGGGTLLSQFSLLAFSCYLCLLHLLSGPSNKFIQFLYDSYHSLAETAVVLLDLADLVVDDMRWHRGNWSRWRWRPNPLRVVLLNGNRGESRRLVKGAQLWRSQFLLLAYAAMYFQLYRIRRGRIHRLVFFGLTLRWLFIRHFALISLLLCAACAANNRWHLQLFHLRVLIEVGVLFRRRGIN